MKQSSFQARHEYSRGGKNNVFRVDRYDGNVYSDNDALRIKGNMKFYRSPYRYDKNSDVYNNRYSRYRLNRFRDAYKKGGRYGKENCYWCHDRQCLKNCHAYNRIQPYILSK